MSAQPQYKPKLVYGALVGGEEVHIDRVDNLGTTPVTTTSGVGASGRHYIGIPCEDSEVVAIQIGWTGTTNSSGNAVQATNMGHQEAKITDETLDKWTTKTGVTVTGPDGLGAGSEFVNIPDVGERRLRLLLTITGNGQVWVWVWSKD